MGFKGSWWGLHTPLNLPHRGSYPTGNGAWLEAANRNYVSVWIRNWQKKRRLEWPCPPARGWTLGWVYLSLLPRWLPGDRRRVSLFLGQKNNHQLIPGLIPKLLLNPLGQGYRKPSEI